MATTEATLCDELEAYCKREGLQFLSAEELVLQEGISEGQRDWLNDYITRWDAFMESEQVHLIPLKTPLELAGLFVTVLRETLEPDQFASVMTGRAEPDDVCDSNMVMSNAFTRLHGRSTWMPSDAEEGRCTGDEMDRDLTLWNAAVEILRSFTSRYR